MRARGLRCGAAAVMAAAACVLAACGGSTATDTNSTSVAPLERPERDASSAERTTEQAPGSTRGDLGAREAESPAPPAPLSEEERQYLDTLGRGGVDVDADSGELVATAQSVCSAEPTGEINVTALAIGGQLVEQGRSRLGPEETARLIENTARDSYCG